MSISIHIDVHPDNGPVADQIRDAMAALGYSKSITLKDVAHAAYDAGMKINFRCDPKEKSVVHTAEEEKAWQEASETASEELISSTETINKSARAPGQPSPGAKRRTKAEIAEDEAAVLAASQRVAAVKADVLADAAAAADSAEDVAQDAADEAAEAAEHKTGLTHDDLRQAAGRYQKKFGMAAAVAGVPTLLGCALIEVPEADLAAAIAKIDAAVAADAPGAIEEKVAEVKAATKEDVMAAMLRYALKYDGQNTDMNAMPKTMEDAPKIFTLLFGEGIVKLSQVPADGFAKTVAAFDEAAAKNPFKR